MIDVAIGPSYIYYNYGLSEGKYLNGTNAYGVLTNGNYILQIGDIIEIKYRQSEITGLHYLFDGPDDGIDRAYASVDNTGLINDNCLGVIEIDGIPVTHLPLDLLEHTFTAVCSSSFTIYNLFTRYSHIQEFKGVYLSLKINNVEQDITWYNTVDVGGEDPINFDYHFETMGLAASDPIYSGTFTEDRNTLLLYKVLNHQGTIKFEYDTDGYVVIFDFNHKLFEDDESYNPFSFEGSGLTQLININYLSTGNKNAVYRGMVSLPANGPILHIINSYFDCFNNLSRVSGIDKSTYTNHQMINCIVKNAYTGFEMWDGTNTTSVIENCLFINCDTGDKSYQASVQANNCIYIDCGAKSFYPANVTSTNDSFNEYTLEEAFIDTIEYLPKEVLKVGGAPIAPGHTHYGNNILMISPYYIGPNGIAGIPSSGKKNNYGTLKVNNSLTINV